MIRLLRRLSILVAFIASEQVAAYDMQTHALMTQVAYSRSILWMDSEHPENANSLYVRLGIDRLSNTNRFRIFWNSEVESYFPSSGSDSFYYVDGGYQGSPPYLTNRPESFERCQMQALREAVGPDRVFMRFLFADTVDYARNSTLLPIQNWLLRGAIREDDMGDGVGIVGLLGGTCRAKFYLTVASQPGRITRSYRHFFDPEFDRGLNVLGHEYPKAVDWALGYQDSFASPAIPATGENRNSYSYLDARNAFWWALTRKISKERGYPNSAAFRESDSQDRMILWATVFRSLGNAIHLLQDTAQPQHSRLDAHSPKDSPQQKAFEGYTNARVLGGGDVGDFVRGFFSPIDEVALTVPSLGSYGEPNSGGTPDANENGSGPSTSFATPLRFFTTRNLIEGDTPGFLARKGLADYSSRGFFTGGTLPGLEGSNPHQSPPSDLLDPSFTIGESFCEPIFKIDSRLTNTICRHFFRAVPDTVNPDYAATIDELPEGFSLPNAPIAADGIFRTFMTQHELHIPIDTSVVTWSPAVLDTIGNLTIPRAISYSTGMLNFFFRGEIKLSPPTDGVYAVVDQGIPHYVPNGLPREFNGQVFGFKKVRVGIRNVTMVDDQGLHTLKDSGTGTIIPQLMHGGTDSSGNPTGHLVAIARYHRNPCYEPDLSGELVKMRDLNTGVPVEPGPLAAQIPGGCTLEETRTGFQEISVSAPIGLDSAGNLDVSPLSGTSLCVNVGNINTGTHGIAAECESEAVLAEFDFSNDPIPINATDLFLQVAYRGPLGLEDDGIAVGIKDLIEPNYISMWNGTDWFYYGSQWMDPVDVPDLGVGNPRGPAAISESFVCIGNKTIATIPSGVAIQAGEFFRIAYLGEAQLEPPGAAVAFGPPMNVGVKVRVGNIDGFRIFPSTHALARQMSKEDAHYYSNGSYDPIPLTWRVRGTTLGTVAVGPYFSYLPEGMEEVRAVVLQPDIGFAPGGIASPIEVGLDVEPSLCANATYD